MRQLSTPPCNAQNKERDRSKRAVQFKTLKLQTFEAASLQVARMKETYIRTRLLVQLWESYPRSSGSAWTVQFESADPTKKHNYTAHQTATKKATGATEGHRMAEVPQLPTNQTVSPALQPGKLWTS